jgi:DHA2 family multidrug resistance protein
MTTMAERRQSFHQSIAGTNLTSSTSLLQASVQQTASYLQTRGLSHADAIQASYARYYQQLIQQTQFLAFMDCFHLIGVFTLVAAPLVLFTHHFKVGSKRPKDH